jgi:hypothetical protein
VGDDLLEEVPRAAALALQSPLHVGHRDKDSVGMPIVDETPQPVDGEHAETAA